MTDIVAELNMIAGSRQSDLNDDGHIIAKGAAEIETLRIALRDCVCAMKADDPSAGWKEIIEAADAALAQWSAAEVKAYEDHLADQADAKRY